MTKYGYLVKIEWLMVTLWYFKKRNIYFVIIFLYTSLLVRVLPFVGFCSLDKLLICKEYPFIFS